jgi:hypothetical protein
MAEKSGPQQDQEKQEPRSRRPPAQSFIAKVVSDPARVPLVWILAGYLGDSSLADHRRLYLGPDLASWVEIPSDAIVHIEEIPGADNWLGAVLVWVRQGVQVTPGNAWSPTAGR